MEIPGGWCRVEAIPEEVDMAICEACNQEMTVATSCEVTEVDIGGRRYDLLPFGQESRFDCPPTTPENRCGDCGVVVGGFHHVGCDVAECPRCHGQLLSCGCLDDLDEDVDDDSPGVDGLPATDRSSREGLSDQLFWESPDPNRITYKGQELVRADRFPVQGAKGLRVVFERVDSDMPQAVVLDSDLAMEINGQEGLKFVLWADTAPPEVSVRRDPKTERIWVSNAWDADGSREPFAWMAGGAMIVEEIPGGRRYRCNDGEEDDDLDDLVFRVERVQ